MSTRKLGFAGRIAHYFINSKLTPLIMVFSILLGAFAVLQTPREEEPQIVVPMMDVFVEMPGSSAQEVEQRVTTPMEKLIWEIPGVEYIYSTTRPGLSMAIVRFKVGEKEEDSIIKLYNKLYSHFDLIPPGASKPIIKPRSIDDVPILALTFWSNRYDSYTLRRVASEVDREIKSIDDVSETKVIGGERRQIRVLLNPTGWRVWRCARRPDGLRSAEPTSAFRSVSLRRPMRSTTSRRATSSATPTMWGAWWWVYPPAARSICAMWPRFVMAPRSLPTTCSSAQAPEPR
jgi:hypothetical protein